MSVLVARFFEEEEAAEMGGDSKASCSLRTNQSKQWRAKLPRDMDSSPRQLSCVT